MVHLRHRLCALLLSAAAVGSASALGGEDQSHNIAAAAAACGFNIYQHTACTTNPYRQLANVTLAVCCHTCTEDNQCAGFTLHAKGGEATTTGVTGGCLMSLGSGIKNPNHHADGVTCGTRSPLPGPSPAPTPGGDDVPLDFDCGTRRLALGYASRVLSGATGQAASVFEALQLGPKCGDHPPPAAPARTAATAPATEGVAAAVSYFLSPTGSDRAAGTSAAPWRTLSRVLAALAQRPTAARPATFVNLYPGVYRLNQTLLVTAAHSGASSDAPVIWRPAPGSAAGQVTISGGVDLSSLTWRPSGKAFAATLPVKTQATRRCL